MPDSFVEFPGIARIVATLIIALSIGTCVRFMATRRSDPETRAKRLQSLRTWWILVLVVSVAVLCGRFGVCLLMLFASLLAMWEFTRLVTNRPADRWSIVLSFGFIAVHYAAIMARSEAVWVVLPLAACLLLPAVQVIQGETVGYIRSTAALSWGMLVLAFGLSHAVMLTEYADGVNESVGPLGWFLYLVVLTEMNDISQALVGRRFGKHKRHRITPRVSPNKTWEGFFGGLIVTILLAAVMAPWLAPIHQSDLKLWDGRSVHIAYLPSVIAGILVSVSGFFGDINMSAIKRDVGVKDSSNLLPGMGGMIDRVDSLTFSAPVFYYYLNWLS